MSLWKTRQKLLRKAGIQTNAAVQLARQAIGIQPAITQNQRRLEWQLRTITPRP